MKEKDDKGDFKLRDFQKEDLVQVTTSEMLSIWQQIEFFVYVNCIYNPFINPELINTTY